MNVTKKNEIYNTLNTYLVEKSLYEPRVIPFALKVSDKFPLVTILEEGNVHSQQTTKTRIRETVSNMYYEINIYTNDKIVDNVKTSRVQIADELKELVDKVMGGYYQFERTLCQPTPNLDENVYRITMRYTAMLLENRDRLI